MADWVLTGHDRTKDTSCTRKTSWRVIGEANLLHVLRRHAFGKARQSWTDWFGSSVILAEGRLLPKTENEWVLNVRKEEISSRDPPNCLVVF